jgi:hypothetical protein
MKAASTLASEASTDITPSACKSTSTAKILAINKVLKQHPMIPGNSAFKPPSRIGDASGFPASKGAGTLPKKHFSLSSAWKTPRRPQKAPAAVRLFDLGVEAGMQRFKLREFFKRPPNLHLRLTDYASYGM